MNESILPPPSPRHGGPFGLPAWTHLKRASKPAWDTGVATTEERALLAAGGKQAPVRGGNAQDYLAWRRSMLVFAFLALGFAVAIGLVAWLVDLLETQPENEGVKYRKGLQGFIDFLHIASYAVMAGLAYLATTKWADLRASHRLLRWGFALGYGIPFVLALVPGSAFFDFAEVPPENAQGVEQFRFLITMIMGIVYFVTLLPTMLSVLVGAIRASMIVKRYAPESAIPGWIAACVAPFFVLFLLIVFILLHHLSGNLLLILGMGFLAVDYLLYVVHGRALTQPTARADLKTALRPLHTQTLVFGGAGLGLLIIALFTMKIGTVHLVGFGAGHMFSPIKLLGLAAEFVGKAMFVAVLFSELLVAVLRHSWNEGQAFRQSELFPYLESRLVQLDDAGISEITVRRKKKTPDGAGAPRT